uniref:Uncharacterized protein n=1 Tax=Glossina palpalis gambiensis TaxID=67801 RepID=A0A1B0BBM1_9MUSC
MANEIRKLGILDQKTYSRQLISEEEKKLKSHRNNFHNEDKEGMKRLETLKKTNNIIDLAQTEAITVHINNASRRNARQPSHAEDERDEQRYQPSDNKKEGKNPSKIARDKTRSDNFRESKRNDAMEIIIKKQIEYMVIKVAQEYWLEIPLEDIYKAVKSLCETAKPREEFNGIMSEVVNLGTVDLRNTLEYKGAIELLSDPNDEEEDWAGPSACYGRNARGRRRNARKRAIARSSARKAERGEVAQAEGQEAPKR